MKRMLYLTVGFILVCAMLSGCATQGGAEAAQGQPPADAAPTAGLTQSPAPEQTGSAPLLDEAAFCRVDITSGEGSADMNGDDAMEAISITASEQEDKTIVSIGKGGGETSQELGYYYNISVFLADFDSRDDNYELFLNGDAASDDYVTIVLRYADGALRYGQLDGTVLGGDGRGHLLVNETVDVLGTFGGNAWYEADDSLSFTRCTPVSIVYNEGFDDSRALKVVLDGLTGTLPNGETLSIPVGTKLWLVETDEQSYAVLRMENDSLVTLNIARSEENWGWNINGTGEDVWFDNLIYCG